MNTECLDRLYSEDYTINIVVRSHQRNIVITVYGSNTLEQILNEYAQELGIDIYSRRISFVNKRSNRRTNDKYLSVNELGLQEGDVLLIQDFVPEATTVFHFMVAYNTLFRQKRTTPMRKDAYHEMNVATSTNAFGHEIKFYLGDSTLQDVVAPLSWMPEGCETKNCLTEGKHPIMIVNEENGKCAMPSEFDMRISDFLADNKQSNSLYIICEDGQQEPQGMHIDNFYFG